jgi:ACS family tartrate transporter-like MFS transporter
MAAAPTLTPLDSARRKAFRRLLPILFASYVIAYVDRQNVAVAKLTMSKDLPAFTNDVIGFGAGLFFIGYFLLEIPGSLIVERWSARKWICRIMLTWGLMAALTGFVQTPTQFYTVRFLLGLAEAGFFPGVIIYLTHWFTARDRAKALSYFLIATPFAQIISPKISNALLKFGTTEVVDGVAVTYPRLLGLAGWQWVYIFWGIPALALGLVVLWYLTDRPKQAKWLTDEEKTALENELEQERSRRSRGKKMTFGQAMQHPKVYLLALAYFCTVTCSYSIEFFMPSVIKSWYNMSLDSLTWWILLPPMGALLGQVIAGRSSDHFQERRWHAIVPILIGAVAVGCVPFTKGNIHLTILAFTLVFAGFKSYMPAFWSLPNLFLVHTAAAGSIGFINSVGNLGGFLGPTFTGWLEKKTGSFDIGLHYLSGFMLLSATIIFILTRGLKDHEHPAAPAKE